MRKVLERYILGSKTLGIFPAATAVYVEDDYGFGLNGVQANQTVIFNYDTGVSVGPGVTVANTPRLVIAQGIDTNGDGVAEVLRVPGSGFLDGRKVEAYTEDTPTCGQVKIIDAGIGCVERGKSFSLIIEARTDHTENFFAYNNFERWTETVEFGFDECEGCDQPLECKEVACALVNKFRGRDKLGSIKQQGSLIRRVRQHQVPEMPFEVYVLHENDSTYCFDTDEVECKGCNRIAGITGITIGEGEDAVTHEFTLTTIEDGEDTFTTLGQVDRVVKYINRILEVDNIGHAINAQTFTGSAKPCCDGVKIIINSCEVVTLLDADGEPIEPCDSGLPVDTVVKEGHCGNCSSSTSWSPCGYIRVVAKPININKAFNTPDSYRKTLYTDLRISTSYNHNNFSRFKSFVRQDYELPRNLGYQLMHAVSAQDTSHNEPFSWGYDQFFGKYQNLLDDSRTSAAMIGLLGHCGPLDSFKVYNIEHSSSGRDSNSQGELHSPKFRLTVGIPSTNTGLITEFEAILDPWIASVPGLNNKIVGA